MSEQTVARIRKDGGWDERFGERRHACRDCGFYHERIRYQGYLDPSGKGEGNWIGEVDDDGPDVGEVIAGVLVLLLVFGATFWALPVIGMYVTR